MFTQNSPWHSISESLFLASHGLIFEGVWHISQNSGLKNPPVGEQLGGYPGTHLLPLRTAKISVLDPSSSSELTALVLPPEMSMPERLQKDVELSGQVEGKIGGTHKPGEEMEKLHKSSRLSCQVIYLISYQIQHWNQEVKSFLLKVMLVTFPCLQSVLRVAGYRLILPHSHWNKSFAQNRCQPKEKRWPLAVAQVIRKMDALLGISDDITVALLGDVSETEIEMKLDIQILYLRRVHHFCFYASRWCKDCTNGCFRNGSVLDSMTCSLTYALDCEWHMIVDVKICCFHVFSFSSQQSNKVAMLSKSYSSAQMKKAGRVELARFLWSCSFAWNSNRICQDWGIVVDRWAREEDQTFLGTFREGACFDSPHRGAPSRAEGLGTFQCRFLPWVSPVVFLLQFCWWRCLCRHEEWGRNVTCLWLDCMILRINMNKLWFDIRLWHRQKMNCVVCAFLLPLYRFQNAICMNRSSRLQMRRSWRWMTKSSSARSAVSSSRAKSTSSSTYTALIPRSWMMCDRNSIKKWLAMPFSEILIVHRLEPSADQIDQVKADSWQCRSRSKGYEFVATVDLCNSLRSVKCKSGKLGRMIISVVFGLRHFWLCVGSSLFQMRLFACLEPPPDRGTSVPFPLTKESNLNAASRGICDMSKVQLIRIVLFACSSLLNCILL